MNKYFNRRYVIQGIFISVAILLLIKLFYIQIIDDKYKLSADNNVLRKLIIYPARGVIVDRKGKILVQNEPVYDLMVIPNQVKAFDTLEFCSLLNITKIQFDKSFKKAKNYSIYRASFLEKQLSAITYAAFQEKADAIKNFSKQIMKIDEVVECHHISGSADFLLKVIVPDIKSYERLILDKISKILEISHLQTMMILSTTKYSHALPLEY